MGTKILKHCRIVTYGQYKGSWSAAKIKDWVEAAGGVHHTKLQDDTTHLVVTKGGWETKGQLVQNAIRANELGKPIKIVGFEWLEECLMSKAKKREGPFIWFPPVKTIDVDADDELREADGKEKKAGNGVGLMREVFDDSTAHYLDSKDVNRLEKQREVEGRIQKEREKTHRNAQIQQKLSIQEQTALFKLGAVRGRTEAFSDIYHIYIDHTGFPYDVVLTKVDVLSNSNQRLCLTIYESNICPPSYAVSAILKQSHQEATNSLIVALGSNWNTAFNAFKKSFEAKTGFEWQDPSLSPSGTDDQRALEIGSEIRRNHGSNASSNTNHYWLYHPRHYVSPTSRPEAQTQTGRSDKGDPEANAETESIVDGPGTLKSHLGEFPSSLVQQETEHEQGQSIALPHAPSIASNVLNEQGESTTAGNRTPEVIILDDDAESCEENPDHVDLYIRKGMRHRSESGIEQNRRSASYPYDSLALGSSLLGKRKAAPTQGLAQKVARMASEPVQ